MESGRGSDYSNNLKSSQDFGLRAGISSSPSNKPLSSLHALLLKISALKEID